MSVKTSPSAGRKRKGRRRRKEHTHLTPSEVLRLIAALEASKRPDGSVGRAQVTEIALAFDVAIETAYRWLRRKKPSARERGARLTERETLLCWRYHGRLSLVLAHLDCPKNPDMRRFSDPTYYRAFKELATWERAAMRTGDKGLREKLQRIASPHGKLNRGELWELDQFLMPVWLSIPSGGKREYKVWMTVIADYGTRKIVSYYPSKPGHAPTRIDVMCAIFCAVSRYGAPTMLRYDNALANLAKDITKMLGKLRIIPVPVDPRDPAKKGMIERAILSIEEMFAAAQPGFDKGPRRINGTLYKSPAPALPQKVFMARLDAFVEWFNTKHRHSGIGRRTPQKAWDADPTELCMHPIEELVWLLIEREERPVQPRGVKAELGSEQGSYYHNSGAIDGLEKVEIANVLYCAPQVHAFSGRSWLGRLDLEPDQEAIIKQRTEHYAYVAERREQVLQMETAELLQYAELEQANETRTGASRPLTKSEHPPQARENVQPEARLVIHADLLGLRSLHEELQVAA